MTVLKNSLYGFVVGDAFGVPVEFREREDLLAKPVVDMIGYGSYDVAEGTWSDDTSMTLAEIDSLADKGFIDYNDMADRFLDWINNGKYAVDEKVFDIGVTTKYALIRYSEDKSDSTKCGGSGYNENGNGSLMRMMPIAQYCFYKKIPMGEIYDIVKKVSSITHAHEISIMGCYIYVRYLLFLLSGKDKFACYNMVKSVDYSEYFSDSTIEKYSRILNGNIKNLKVDDISSSGYAVDTLEAVLWVVLNSEDYKDSIIASANLGSDTDTIAAITGSITGILFGYDSIPRKWLDKLKGKSELDKYIEKFDERIISK